MTGSAHRHLELRHDVKRPAAGTPKATAPDGEKVDYKGMQAAEARKAAARGGKGVPGESGSEILDYQKPYEQDGNRRSRG